MAHVAERLGAVVERDDVAGTDIAYYASETAARRDGTVVVARQHAPHDDLETLADDPHLRRRDARIGRAEELRAHDRRGVVDILDISFERHPPTLLVRIGVVADLVPCGEDTVVEVGVHLGVLAQHEECGLGVVLLQGRQYPLRNAGRRTVVESQEDGFGVVDAPYHVGVEASYETGRIDSHSVKLRRYATKITFFSQTEKFVTFVVAAVCNSETFALTRDEKFTKRSVT